MLHIQLYANYKQGTGEDFSKATQPGTFAFQVRSSSLLPPPSFSRLLVHLRAFLANIGCCAQEKYKYNAWKKVAVEDKVTPSAAQQHYVQLVEKLKGVYGFGA